MNDETVRILITLEPLKYVEISRDCVPNGYYGVYLKNVGAYFVAPGLLKYDPTVKLRHGPMPEPARAELKRFYRAFAGMYGRTPDKWEEGFREDRTP